jgi:hypothetical protein
VLGKKLVICWIKLLRMGLKKEVMNTTMPHNYLSKKSTMMFSLP